MTNPVRDRLDGLPADLSPISDVGRALLDQPGDVSADGVLRLGHRPWVAPENYSLTLYPGINADALSRYAVRFGLAVPPVYAEFLSAVNGAFLFGMTLAGVPLSMLGSPPWLDRTRLQSHDLGMAATYGAAKYCKSPPGPFHFGSRHYSYHENVGYVLSKGQILCVRECGIVVRTWDSFSEFLQDELKASAALDAELYPRPGN